MMWRATGKFQGLTDKPLEKIMSAAQPRVVILDLDISNGDSMNLLTNLSGALTNGSALIAITAAEDVFREGRVLNSGATHYILKLDFVRPLKAILADYLTRDE